MGNDLKKIVADVFIGMVAVDKGQVNDWKMGSGIIREKPVASHFVMADPSLKTELGEMVSHFLRVVPLGLSPNGVKGAVL